MDLTKLNLPGNEQKILEAAIDVFSEKGFSRATTSEIAKRAGVAEGTIFRYFKVKKDILRGILIQMIYLAGEPVIIEGVSKILLDTQIKDLREVLKSFIKDRLQLIESLYPMIKIIITEALYHEDIREAFFENVTSRGVEIFTIFHRRMLERGLIRKNLDALAMARSIMGNIFLFVVTRQFIPEKFISKNTDEELDTVIDIIMYGIAVPEISK
ncbi:MAG: helix-turn-helix domain-containing protein [Smithella sp.]|jgi:AcrR family transcriptional regulator